jgi:hypothetical protein
MRTLLVLVVAIPNGEVRADTDNFPFVSVHFEPSFWVGGYGHIVYDSGTETGRVSFGPEIGCLILGLDGGLVRELGGSSRWGFAIRPSITIPVSLKPMMTLSLYARGEMWKEGPDDSEVGLLLKYTFPFTR